MVELIDSHCHLDNDYSPKTDADLVREAGLAGVARLITVATDMKSVREVAEISARHPNVFHTAGVHPHEARTLGKGDLDVLRRAAAHPKCRAIGEIGLDYHYDHSPRETQRAVLVQQLGLALETGLPVVIHSREAEDDLLAALREYADALPRGAIPGVIHCFTGTRAFGEACLKLGFYISFSGILTFKTAEDLRACAAAFPLERLLVETDSPFLAPIPHRGKRCEPSMVTLTAQKLAEVRGTTLDEIARATTANARAVFGLS
jgi:TatD DNase family protein